ncbi:AAA family ATPase, partial [Streptomyces botrytidirepellens]
MTIVGRERESAAVLGVTSGVLIVTGEPGAGKSTLLALAADRHQGRVLRMTGSESEANLPFAGLHQLLRPILDDAARLPARQRSALLGAIGAIGAEDTGPPDRLLLGVALLALLSDLAQRSPLLVLVDDLHWIDTGSLEALAFAARRIDGEPLAVLAGARDTTGAAAPAAFSGFPTLALGPLDASAAVQLLDRQPYPPTGGRRMRVLDQAAGNPLALVELARAYGTDGAYPAGDSTAEDLLPPTDRLMRLYAADLDALPEATRRALLLVAADERAVAGRIEALAPAEAAGLLRITGGGEARRARFRHPLIRSAIYHSVPLAARRQAHRDLAASLTGEPDRRAWHLAAAAEGPDEEIAAALEESASRARTRGGYTAAVTALERAAELSPAPHDRARRLVAAAREAVATGQPH